MKTILFWLSALALGLLVLLTTSAQQNAASPAQAKPDEQQTEKHLRNIKQLTFGGQNAEAYFSADGKMLIFQSNRDPLKCDQIFVMNTDGSDQRMISNGKGRTTCSFFFPDGKRVLYSSTHL
ncbi:MAG TPA: hypothetical protein VLL05_05100, partial [Terriglobales bacterium]|nr:hypothetical protein [Terriglobales bacterium]